MFNSIFSLGNFFGVYSGAPLLASVAASASNCTSNGQPVPCSEVFNFMMPFLAILAPILFFIWLIGMALCVLLIISWWKIFEKAGRPGWAAIVPIYNLVVIFQLVGMSPWLILLILIPGFGALALFVVMIFVNIKLTKAFGKDEGFAVGLILLPIVFVPILAFDSSKFIGTPTASAV